MTRPAPTPLDIENAARRQQIADRFRRQYKDALALAESVLGPGWEPTGRHYLIDRDDEDRCRRANTKPASAATVITGRNAAGDLRHFRVETMTECPTPEAGFGDLLLENHPTKRFTVKGVEYPIHRFSLCWGWFEPGYKPQTAEQLAAARAKREDKAVEKEADGNLFADQIRAEGYVQKRTGPGR